MSRPRQTVLHALDEEESYVMRESKEFERLFAILKDVFSWLDLPKKKEVDKITFLEFLYLFS